MEKDIGAKALAFLGDAVFTLKVRVLLLSDNERPPDELSRRAKKYVTASAQASFYHKIFPLLNEEEQGLLKRGRNSSGLSKTKNANTSDYRHATGLETLFGYLFLSGNETRLNEIFNMCIKE
ncbi:MAG: ribonuclease III [Defluviitaleaceae bacterium]|nr:ribonuclease III [Defluviitaleaceae bacterium]